MCIKLVSGVPVEFLDIKFVSEFKKVSECLTRLAPKKFWDITMNEQIEYLKIHRGVLSS